MIAMYDITMKTFKQNLSSNITGIKGLFTNPGEKIKGRITSGQAPIEQTGTALGLRLLGGNT